MATSRTRNDIDDADVVAIDSVVDFDLDAQDTDSQYPPFRVRVGGHTFTLTEPDAGLVMELEEAGTTRRFCQLVFDEQWPDVAPLLEGKRPDVLAKLIRDYGQHFDMDQQAVLERAAPNRAERRRRRTRR